jgi:hypothetical protein
MFLSRQFVFSLRQRLVYTHDERRLYWHHHDWTKGHDQQ